MRILQLANRVPWPLKDGGAIAIYNMACSYAEEGNQLTLFCLNTVKHQVDVGSLPTPFHKQFRLVDAPIDNRVRLIPALINLFRSDSYNISRFWSKEVALRIAEVATELQPEMVQFEGPFMLPYLPVIREAVPKACCIMRAHNVEHRIWERMAESVHSKLKARYFRLLARRLKQYEVNTLNQLDGFLPISETDLTTFRELGITIPALVSSAGMLLRNVNMPIIDSAPGQFSFIGSLDWLPNTEALDWLLVEVWPLVLQKAPDFVLHVAGRNMPKRYRQYQSECVKIYGEVEDGKDFLRNHGPLLVPLLSGSGVRIKILEALAEGQAVISTATGAEGLELQHNQQLLIANTASEFADAIVTLGNSPELSRRLGENGWMKVQSSYTQQVQTRKIINWIKEGVK